MLQHVLRVALWKCSVHPRSQPPLLACLARLTIWQLSAWFHVFLPSMEAISSLADCRGNDIMSTSRGSWTSLDAGGSCLVMIQKCSPSWRKERFWVKIPTQGLSVWCWMFSPCQHAGLPGIFLPQSWGRPQTEYACEWTLRALWRQPGLGVTFDREQC